MDEELYLDVRVVVVLVSSGSRGSRLTCTFISGSFLQFSEFEMIIYTEKSTLIYSNFNFLKATVRGEKR